MDASNTFTLLPMGQTMPLKAGETATGSITVINQQNSAEPFSFRVSVAPYGVKGDGYDADLVTETEMTQLAKWVTIENPTGTLEPGKSTEVNFTINVPKDAPGGGQYAAIVVSSDNQSSDPAMVEYVYEMASIIFGEVAGKTVHEGSIVSHSVPGFSTTPKVAIDAVLENKGNIHEHARIDLTVSEFFSGEDIFSTEESEVPTTELIMPYSTRNLVRNLTNLPSLGVVTVKETIKYLGETSTIEKQIYICPLWFLLLAAFTIIAIIGTIISRVRHHRRHKRHEIETA
ncbi:hypothetical protein IKG31_01315 [Candidatus Saccharibacteria bacterium]|nr:hypothetical protein [Candidatus Saccharibacteria bacterium]